MLQRRRLSRWRANLALTAAIFSSSERPGAGARHASMRAIAPHSCRFGAGYQLCATFSARHFMAELISPTERTRVVREPHRGSHDREVIYRILDEGLVCHVGFSMGEQPYVIPTMFARVGDHIYFHGSAASRMLRGLCGGLAVCVTVTLADGLVLARSVFNHSMNYRSVVALGKASLIEEPQEKLEALRAFTEKILLGRWEEVRQPSEKELKATSILRLPLTEVSAKMRVGAVEDDAPDYELPVWAGIIPLKLVAGAPLTDARCAAGTAVPGYAKNYSR
jgi:nitroimidazol reductase NimA-like FMN-containing flavoprotein (pyridoxamine 5'-phosphate oxidase superfamily)